MSFSKQLITICILLTALFLGAAPSLAQGPLPPAPTGRSNFVSGEIVVKFQPHVRLLGAQGSLRAEGLQALEASPRSGLVRVQVRPGREAETIAALMARGDVEFAALNHVVEALGDPNDTSYSLQWALNKIDAPEAWDIHTGTGNVTIAIVDTGVDLNHPDLQAKIVPGYDFVNDDNVADDDNYQGHGTHVAGIAAAVSNNGTGIAGVSWDAKIMPLKVLNASGSGSSLDVADAIYYAVDNGAHVINLSLGVPGTSWPCSMPDLEAAFDYALDHDVLVVVASGNDYHNEVGCPAAYDQAMAVGSTTSSDTRSSFSNYGDRLDIAAPGSGIYSTLKDGGYGFLGGTSMATPHVAGLAALLRSYDSSLSAAEVRTVIEDSADDLGPSGWDQYFGHGRINAWQALKGLSLQVTPEQLTLFIDDESDPIYSSIQVDTASTDLITWTASIAPAVSWLEVSPPDSGSISAASAPIEVTTVTTRPTTYNTYEATVVISGTTSSGTVIGPKETNVRLYYVSKIYKQHLPIIMK